MPGHPLIYCASSKASAFAEVGTVASDTGLDGEPWIHGFRCVRIDVPREVSRERIILNTLPPNWAVDKSATQQIGMRWLLDRRSCILRVPSISVPGDAHYLINPVHRDFEILFVGPPRRWEDFEDYDALFNEAEEKSHWEHRVPALLERFSREYGPKEVFLCHAPADRERVVIPFMENALFDLGISSWADFAEITVGDSIIGKVNQGLSNAKFVVVVVSPDFLKEKNALRQLNSALARESASGKKVVLPIILNYPNEKVDLVSALPLVADKAVHVWTGDASDTAFELKRAIER